MRAVARYLLLCLPCFAVIVAAVAAPAPPSHETFFLKNGLEVIVIPNHRLPVVSHTIWYRVGATDDPLGKSGLAHYVEHMMFLGSAHTPPGDFAKIVTRRGGNHNAFTGRDMTGYYVNIAKQYLPMVMQMEADRMARFGPPADQFAHEREVIIEERRMRVDNDPSALLSEQMQAALFLNHPYRLPVIGWKHEMAGLQPADVMRLHQLYYVPSNALLVVAGDITRQEVQALAQEYYGPIAAGHALARHWLAEPPNLAPRRLVMHHAEVRQPAWTRRYAVPSFAQGDTAQALPLYLLAQWWGGGDTSRLYRSLVVKQKLATQASADYDGLSIGPGEFTISAVPAPGVTPERLEQAIDEELRALPSHPPTEEEFQRAKTVLKAELFYARDGLQQVAHLMGQLRMIGMPAALFDEWPARVDKVTAANVMQAAKLLDGNASVTGILLPSAAKETKHE